MTSVPFRTGLMALLSISLLGLGCEKAAQESPAFDPTKVEVGVIDRAGFQDILARHAGEVVFVDYWAMW